MKLVIVCMLFATALAAPAGQSLTFHDDGSYRFYYDTGEEGGSHSRSEVRNPDGVVIGKFSYQDSDGEIREVNYRADESGFVAQGDVGVKGAPKGKFPAVEDQPQKEIATTEIAVTTEENPAQSSQSVKQQQTLSREHHYSNSHDEEGVNDDIQDLVPEETAALDDPPDGFPPGFFLQKFQGLRRLPEPTSKEPATTTTTASPKSSQPETPQTGEDVKKESEQTSPIEVKAGESTALSPWNPFRGLSPQEWAAAMYHQPVYVFSYNQPDSYGYHYFF